MSAATDRLRLGSIRLLAERVRQAESEPSPLETSRAELRQAIREAHAAGHTLQAIGDAAGISRQRVSQLLAKEER